MGNNGISNKVWAGLLIAAGLVYLISPIDLGSGNLLDDVAIMGSAIIGAKKLLDNAKDSVYGGGKIRPAEDDPNVIPYEDPDNDNL